MKTFTYSILNGCLPCAPCFGVPCEGESQRPMIVGDEVVLFLKKEVLPTLPEKTLANVVAVSTESNVTTYLISYNEIILVGTGLLNLEQSFVKDFPKCYSVIDKLTDRIKLLEQAVFPA